MPISLPSELTDLRREILTMGAEVEQRVHLAIEALFAGDASSARAVRTSDDEIDQMEVDIEQECLRILALTHPVAGDLRFVLSVMRINYDLERIGDLAKSIAKRSLDLQELPNLDYPNGLRDMAKRTRQMLGDALASFSDGNAQQAHHVRRADQRVDDLLKEIFSWVQAEIPQHVDHTQSAIDILSIARKLERIADISTNIAEDVIFLIEGTSVRHAEP